jgi:hypothetical protein
MEGYPEIRREIQIIIRILEVWLPQVDHLIIGKSIQIQRSGGKSIQIQRSGGKSRELSGYWRFGCRKWTI